MINIWSNEEKRRKESEDKRTGLTSWRYKVAHLPKRVQNRNNAFCEKTGKQTKWDETFGGQNRQGKGQEVDIVYSITQSQNIARINSY